MIDQMRKKQDRRNQEQCAWQPSVTISLMLRPFLVSDFLNFDREERLEQACIWRSISKHATS